jgi:hypothetical protein
VDLVDDARQMTRRVRVLFGYSALAVVVALGAIVTSTVGPPDRVGLATGAPAQLEEQTDDAAGRDTTATSAADLLEDLGVDLDLDIPPIDLPPITVPGVDLPPIDVPPIDLDPDDGGIEPAYGEVFTSDNLPPMSTDYTEPQGPPSLLSGKVTNVHNAPVGGTCIDVIELIMNGDRHHATAKTNVLGRYELRVPNGIYRVMAVDCRGIAPGHAPANLGIAMAPGQPGIVDLRVPDGAALRLQVTHMSGAPRAGWCAQVISEPVITWAGALGGRRTDANGFVTLTGLQPGVGRVVVSEDCDWMNQRDGSASEHIDLPANQVTDLALAPWTCTTGPAPVYMLTCDQT